MAIHSHTTTTVVRHTVTVPAHSRDGVAIGDLHRALTAAESAYLDAHPDTTCVPDDAIWVTGDDSGFTIAFEFEEPQR